MIPLLFRFICFFILLAPFFCHPASANIYRYTDDNGNFHYSNNASEIPRRYHDTIVVENEIEYQETETPAAESDNKTDATDQNTDSGRTRVYDFKARERELANEYERLLETKEALDKAQAEASTPIEIMENNKKIRDFNRQLEEHRKKRQVLEKEIEEYNALVKENFEKSLQKAQQAKKKEPPVSKDNAAGATP